jgi:aspartate-semialdehyde dehydrogenase
MNEDRLRRSPNVGIIGSSSLLGRELKEMIEDGGFPLGRLILLETEEYAGLLQEFAGDIQITQIISPDALKDVDIAFFACSAEIMQAYIASGAPFPDLTIDLTQSGRDGRLFLSGLSDASTLDPRGYFINPHPAAIVIARVLSRLNAAFGVRSSSVTVLEPASERGNTGVDELQEQTVHLLNFQNVEGHVFTGQLSFNILPEPVVAQRTEDRIVEQVATLLGTGFPRPVLTALQVPVFHSHGFSMFVQLIQEPSPAEIRETLGHDSAFIVYEKDEGPSPVGAVGTHGIHVGRIHANADQPGTIALWAVADNLRIAASNAIRTAENIMLAAIGR